MGQKRCHLIGMLTAFGRAPVRTTPLESIKIIHGVSIMQTLPFKSAMASLLAAASMLLFSHQALADKASIKANLGAARERVVAVVNGKAQPAAVKSEIANLSAMVDAEADSVPGFKPVWEQFKANRDGKILPAFDGGKPEDKDAAKALALSEQKQLYEKMLSLLQ